MFPKIPKIPGSFFKKILIPKFPKIRKISDLIFKIFVPKIPRILKVSDLIFVPKISFSLQIPKFQYFLIPFSNFIFLNSQNYKIPKFPF